MELKNFSTQIRDSVRRIDRGFVRICQTEISFDLGQAWIEHKFVRIFFHPIAFIQALVNPIIHIPQNPITSMECGILSMNNKIQAN